MSKFKITNPLLKVNGIEKAAGIYRGKINGLGIDKLKIRELRSLNEVLKQLAKDIEIIRKEVVYRMDG